MSVCEELRKEIIYATHVLRYAGKGHLYGAYNFNTKGRLTGIDELDTLDIDHPEQYPSHDDNGDGYGGYGAVDHYGEDKEDGHHDDFLGLHGGNYAQVAKAEHHFDESDGHYDHDFYKHANKHHYNLKQRIDDAKQAFDDMVQGTRDEFRGAVDTELVESEERRTAINDLVGAAGDDAAADLSDFSGEQIDTLTQSNADRTSSFQTDSQALLDEFLAKVQVQTDKVNKWFGDRLEWIEKLHDEYYKNHLKKELTEKRDHALADLGARAQLAEAKAFDASENLRINQDAALDDLVGFAISE